VRQADESEVVFCSIGPVAIEVRDLSVLLLKIAMEMKTEQTPPDTLEATRLFRCPWVFSSEVVFSGP